MDLLPEVIENDEEPKISDAIHEEVPEPEPQPEEIVEVIERPKLDMDTIFQDDKPKKEKKPRAKRECTPAQLETLRKAREKGLATRRAKAEEKRKLKELENKVKEKKVKDMQEYVEDKPKPIIKPIIEEPRPEPIDIKKITSEAVRDALQEHEKARQVRKQKKKAIQRDEQHKQNLNNLIHNVPKPRPVRYGDAGFFDKCF